MHIRLVRCNRRPSRAGAQRGIERPRVKPAEDERPGEWGARGSGACRASAQSPQPRPMSRFQPRLLVGNAIRYMCDVKPTLAEKPMPTGLILEGGLRSAAAV